MYINFQKILERGIQSYLQTELDNYYSDSDDIKVYVKKWSDVEESSENEEEDFPSVIIRVQPVVPYGDRGITDNLFTSQLDVIINAYFKDDTGNVMFTEIGNIVRQAIELNNLNEYIETDYEYVNLLGIVSQGGMNEYDGNIVTSTITYAMYIAGVDPETVSSDSSESSSSSSGI